ncbi:hypothetical protein [Enterococcus canintestini]|uniref:hypothetical protein n=1 Tax=Enterococcus canintestini TaxID=317010 RepID=UPI0015D9815C|nr:hypothetical protein [Enterococcus canintestini]
MKRVGKYKTMLKYAKMTIENDFFKKIFDNEIKRQKLHWKMDKKIFEIKEKIT